MADESWLNKAKREIETGLMHWDETRRKKNALKEIQAVENRIKAKEAAQSSVAETPTEQDNLISRIKKRNKQIEEAGQ